MYMFFYRLSSRRADFDSILPVYFTKSLARLSINRKNLGV
jgi:hypothetical protein